MFSPLRNRASRRLREPFGKAGLTVAVVALVFAMLGGAYAAGGLTGKQKKEVKKIAKSFQGTGPAGAQGPAGAAGAKGDAGSNGSNGSNGSDGADGESVTGAPIAAGGECGAGVTGVNYTLDGDTTKVCNGKNGTTGFTETLPSNKTETGTWAASLPGTGSAYASISFSIPLAESPKLVFVAMKKYYDFDGEFPEVPIEKHQKAVQEEGAENGCPGINAEGLPMAEPGTLCVYGSHMFSSGEMKPGGTPVARTKLPNGPPAEPAQIFLDGGFVPQPEENGRPGGGTFISGAGPAGTTLTFECTAQCRGGGAWAVTAE